MTASAQTQQGIVKTKGRMVNGKLVQGQGLKGATVTIQGRTPVAVQNANGSFSFPIPGQTFRVTSVKKNGYQLVDLDAISKSFKYSSNPIYLIMEKPEQQQADLLAKERKLRRDLQRRLQQKEDEVETLNVSIEEKNRLLQEINKERDENEKIIRDLSQYYATLDYDQLSEFQRRVSDLLENGELERADSLLRTRGDMNERIRQVQSEQQHEAQREAELAQQQQQLADSKAGTQRKLDDIAADCLSFHQRFLAAHENDSAAYYIELRAQLDTTNVEWQNEAGLFISGYIANYPKALSYFLRTLRLSLIQFGEKNERTARAYNNIGFSYHSQGNFSYAMEYYQKALEIRIKVFGEEHPNVALSYNNIASIYDSHRDYAHAMEYLQKALDIKIKTLGERHPDVATTYNNIGSLYSSQGDLVHAMEYLQKALDIRIKTFGYVHPDVATTYNNIGGVFDLQGEYAYAIEYFQKALDIWIKVYGEEHPDVAISYNNIGGVYDSLGELSRAMNYYQNALDIRRKVFGEEHPDVASSYNNIGGVYDSKGDYALALEYYQKALDILTKVYGAEHPETRLVNEEVSFLKYRIALESGDMGGFLTEHVFTATVVDGDTPARRKGMEGEYILLEYLDWNQDCNTSLFDKNEELRGKPKDIVVMRDGVISRHHFENTIGVQFGIKPISKEERKKIDEAYKKWKEEQRKKE